MSLSLPLPWLISDFSLPPGLVGHISGYFTITITPMESIDPRFFSDFSNVTFQFWGSQEWQLIDLLRAQVSIPKHTPSLCFPVRTSKELFAKYLKDMNEMVFSFRKESSLDRNHEKLHEKIEKLQGIESEKKENVNILVEMDTEAKLDLKNLSFDNEGVAYDGIVPIFRKGEVAGKIQVKLYFGDPPKINTQVVFSEKEEKTKSVVHDTTKVATSDLKIVETPSKNSSKSSSNEPVTNNSKKSHVVQELLNRAQTLKRQMENLEISAPPVASAKPVLLPDQIQDTRDNITAVMASIESQPLPTSVETDSVLFEKIFFPKLEENSVVAENKKSSVLLKFLSVEIDSNAVLNLCKKGKVISEISCFCKYGFPLGTKEKGPGLYSSSFNLPVKSLPKKTLKSTKAPQKLVYDNPFETRHVLDPSHSSNWAQLGVTLNISISPVSNVKEAPILGTCFFLLSSTDRANICYKSDSKIILGSVSIYSTFVSSSVQSDKILPAVTVPVPPPKFAPPISSVSVKSVDVLVPKTSQDGVSVSKVIEETDVIVPIKRYFTNIPKTISAETSESFSFKVGEIYHFEISCSSRYVVSCQPMVDLPRVTLPSTFTRVWSDVLVNYLSTTSIILEQWNVPSNIGRVDREQDILMGLGKIGPLPNWQKLFDGEVSNGEIFKGLVPLVNLIGEVTGEIFVQLKVCSKLCNPSSDNSVAKLKHFIKKPDLLSVGSSIKEAVMVDSYFEPAEIKTDTLNVVSPDVPGKITPNSSIQILETVSDSFVKESQRNVDATNECIPISSIPLLVSEVEKICEEREKATKIVDVVAADVNAVLAKEHTTIESRRNYIDLVLEKHSPDRVINTRATSGNNISDLHLTVSVESALHLPLLNMDGTVFNPSMTEMIPTLPCTYVSTSISSITPIQFTTPVVLNSTSPSWNSIWSINVPNNINWKDLAKMEILMSLYHRPPFSTIGFGAPTRDIFIGSSTIELAPLVSGLSPLYGWYNIYNEVSTPREIRGQIRIKIEPSASLLKLVVRPTLKEITSEKSFIKDTHLVRNRDMSISEPDNDKENKVLTYPLHNNNQIEIISPSQKVMTPKLNSETLSNFSKIDISPLMKPNTGLSVLQASRQSTLNVDTVSSDVLRSLEKNIVNQSVKVQQRLKQMKLINEVARKFTWSKKSTPVDMYRINLCSKQNAVSSVVSEQACRIKQRINQVKLNREIVRASMHAEFKRNISKRIKNKVMGPPIKSRIEVNGFSRNAECVSSLSNKQVEVNIQNVPSSENKNSNSYGPVSIGTNTVNSIEFGAQVDLNEQVSESLMEVDFESLCTMEDLRAKMSELDAIQNKLKLLLPPSLVVSNNIVECVVAPSVNLISPVVESKVNLEIIRKDIPFVESNMNENISLKISEQNMPSQSSVPFAMPDNIVRVLDEMRSYNPLQSKEVIEMKHNCDTGVISSSSNENFSSVENVKDNSMAEHTSSAKETSVITSDKSIEVTNKTNYEPNYSVRIIYQSAPLLPPPDVESKPKQKKVETDEILLPKADAERLHRIARIMRG